VKNIKTLDLFVIIAVTHCHLFSTVWAAEVRNVLFILIDDLRPDLGAFQLTAAGQMGGARLPVRSLVMNRLADQGVVFERAYYRQAKGYDAFASFRGAG
jgi:arylsulfatase A-like enzyme